MHPAILSTILDAPTFTSPPAVSYDDELALLGAARGGDAAAHSDLLALYGAFLRASLHDLLRRQSDRIDRDEARAIVLLAYGSDAGTGDSSS